ncbi:MAG: hypothetical protein J0M20_04500 [Burkholderiales bacterium]|nr:hypothetical protein [Burkholderiales bacterium]
MKRRSLMGALLVLPLQAMAATGYSALDVTPADSSDCRPLGLNASGQVAGWTALAGTGQTRGFVTGPAGANARLIETLGGSGSWLGKINDPGQAVGLSYLPGDVSTQAIVVEAGSTVPTPIGVLGRSGSARAINNKGRVIGNLYDPSDHLEHAFITRGRGYRPRLGEAGLTQAAVLIDGTVAGTTYLGTSWRAYITGPDASGMTLLDTLGGTFTAATGMNKHRVVVGWASNADSTWHHAFVTDPGGSGLRDLGLPAPFSMARAINKHGQIVGSYTIDAPRDVAFVAKIDGSWKALDSVVTLPDGATLTDAFDINDVGQITAYGSNMRCYLLTPTP